MICCCLVACLIEQLSISFSKSGVNSAIAGSISSANQCVCSAQGRGRRLVKFSYLNHPTKVDVTSGQIGAQQLVSAKSNDGIRVRHDFFGFLSHPYQEL